ncbi:MAG: ATP-binding cassette domain-containing protein [Clostridia bacterium]
MNRKDIGEGANNIMYNRISIVGGSGSGKSTLCNILSKELNLPAIHLDAINFNANWIEIDKEERDKIISTKSSESKWIIDGNYNQTLKERFDKADLIIWLDYSTFMQLKGIFKRFLKTCNKERTEIPGCKERLDFKFIKYVATYNKKKRHIIVDNLKDIPKDKVLIFKKQKDLNKWLKEFTHNDNILANLK